MRRRKQMGCEGGAEKVTNKVTDKVEDKVTEEVSDEVSDEVSEEDRTDRMDGSGRWRSEDGEDAEIRNRRAKKCEGGNKWVAKEVPRK
jgi:hypothetical protein